ncbi:uncharacterized protein ACRADG_001290 isoform 2-T2 [Cochliomyia hominivorax]
MISDTQSEPSMHHLDLFTKHHNTSKSDVNLSTQLSIADHRYDSPIATSTQHLFTCQPNNNSIGNLSFPLTQKDTKKYIEKISWHDLLKQLKSQKIVKNIDIFHKFKRNQQYDINTQQFPLEIDQRLEKDNFPCQNKAKINNEIKRKRIKSLAKLKFPLKANTGLTPFPLQQSDPKKHRTVFKIKKFNLLPKTDLSTRSSRRNLKKFSQSKQLKNFPNSNKHDFRNKNKFPLYENFSNNSDDKETILKFPEKLPQNQDKFPFEYKFENKSKTKQDFERLEFITFPNPLLSYKNAAYNSIIKTKFPCELNLKNSKLLEFPFNNENVEMIEKQTQQNKLLNNNHPNNNNWNKVNYSNNLKTTSSSCFPSLSMTQNGQNIDNEHVSQVQDEQTYIDENLPTTPLPKTLKISENNLTPPQTTLAKTTNNNNVDDDSDVYILAAINSINNTRPNEVVVGKYVEKIERIEDAIVALFKTIQQNLQTNHNKAYESTNASKHDHDRNNDDNHNQHDENIARFALTPPMSVTSVRKIESNENNEKVPQNIPNICDLVDLCNREVGGQIVECSDVRDTLAEAVDYGVTKKETNTTGSFLVKSEGPPTSPNSPIPQTLNESNIYTSHIDYSNASENLLPKYNVLGVNIESKKFHDKNNNLESDPNKANDINDKISSEIIIPILDTCQINNNNSLISENVSEMTITRLADSNEQGNYSENNHLQTSEALKHKSDILSNDLQIDEMKYEMNRVKGALPSSVSERAALSKNDHVGTGNSHYNRHNPINNSRLTSDSSVSNSRLPTSLNSTRNNNDSSYTPRSSAKNDSSSSSSLAHTGSKRSSLTSHLPHDGVTHRSSLNSPHSSHENTSTRSGLTPAKYSNDISTEATPNRRPSLGSLQQSPLLQSVDLPRYTPASSTNRTEPNSSTNRSISSESSFGDALPERTRLRRQRRLRSQDSQDEQEDPIERLNRLKARISASLSEVKGVLKQYSTEGENEQENQATASNAITPKETKQEVKKPEVPVTFRFVKKIRRRSLFSEEEEENDKKKDETKAKEKTESHEETDEKRKDDTDNIKTEINSKLPVENSENKKEQIEQLLEKPSEENIEEVEKIKFNDVNKQPPTELKEVKINKDLYTLKEEAQETLENNINGEANLEAKIPPQVINKEIHNEDNNKAKEEPQIVQEEKEVNDAKAETEKIETKPLDSEHSTKTKKRIIVKTKDPARRASLAAVEGSKIEPPVKVAIPAKIHRRPSDSEAVVKKKLITAKINTSGIVEEVTPKPKIVKVKKSIIKTNKNSQLATTQEKSKDEEEKGKNTAATVITTNDKKCDNHVKSINEDNKSIHIDKKKDVLLPKQLEQQQQPKQQEQQQQINNINTSQTNLLLPTQLVIDEAASLNLKTIENSVLQPKQQQREQNQQSQHDKQATINSSTTNIKSNDLQVGGAMLENLTTVLSSSKTSEANGQIERENIIVQSDNLSDLLQQESTIIKPSTVTNKTKEQNNTKPEENQQTKLKNLLLKQASAEKFQDNLEHQQKSIIEQKQKQQQEKQKQEQQKQVVATTDVVVVKSEDDNENIKVNKDSLKEPCIDKTPTSTHIVAEHQNQQQQQKQQQDQHHNQLLIEGEQSITHATTTANTKTISSPHISISSNSDLTPQTTETLLPNATVNEDKTTAVTANEQNNEMPELQLSPAPVQTAEIIPHPEQHKKKTILKKIVRQSSIDKSKKSDTEESPTSQEAKPETAEENQETETPITSESPKDELSEECSESTEVSETSTSQGSEELPPKPKKERTVKKKVIIKRQKRRLSIGDNFFHPGVEEESQNTEIETLEKPIAYVSDDESDDKSEQQEEAKEEEEPKKPLKSCIMQKEYHIGDIVLYAERYRKTQVRWRRGRIKERITSISYLLDIDGKDVSSHINYLKKWTGRKVSFGAKEYLEIDYEQLAEEEEKAERLKRRTYSIWNMVTEN